LLHHILSVKYFSFDYTLVFLSQHMFQVIVNHKIDFNHLLNTKCPYLCYGFNCFKKTSLYCQPYIVVFPYPNNHCNRKKKRKIKILVPFHTLGSFGLRSLGEYFFLLNCSLVDTLFPITLHKNLTFCSI